MPINCAPERDRAILKIVNERGYVSLHDLAVCVHASSSTLRRDLDRLHAAGKLMRVMSGVLPSNHGNGRIPPQDDPHQERENIGVIKDAVAGAAAALCQQGEAVIIDGGNITPTMCSHVAGLGLHVLTNSLTVLSALLAQPDTHVSVTGGMVFRGQNTIFNPLESAVTAKFHASKMFLSPTAVASHGLMQSNAVMLQTQHGLIDQADELIVLVDSSKFSVSAGYVICELSRIHTLITDSDIGDEHAAMIEGHGIKLVTVDS